MLDYHQKDLLETLGRKVDMIAREISIPGSRYTNEDLEEARRAYDEALAKATSES